MNNQNGIKDHATEFLDDDEAIRIENTLWWVVGRRSILANFLKLTKRQTSIYEILEIGCGSGGDLSLLSEYGAVSGIERSPVLARRARERKVAKKIYEKDFFDLDVNDHFDLCCFFDVLEHVKDDKAFLKRLSARMQSGDLLLLSVPACHFLYSQHDLLLHHYRRYSRPDVEHLLSDSGYEMIKISYFFFFLFPIAAASRMKEKLISIFREKKQTQVNIGLVPAWLNKFLTYVLKTEAVISKFFRFPIGLWLIALARKR